jgi:hypothetical protein
MRKSYKLLGGLVLVGLLAAGGSAFTATGVTDNAPATQFLGGTVSQTVQGATLSTIAYSFYDASNTAVTAVTLTFTNAQANGKTAHLVLNPATTNYAMPCDAVIAGAGPYTATCTVPVGDYATGFSALNAINVIVDNAP